MLDFALLQQQLNAMVFEQHAVRRDFTQKIALAREQLEYWSGRWEALGQKIKESRTSWLLAADIREAFHHFSSPPSLPSLITVIATDGSQVFPDRHEFVDCYLVNIGTVVLHYGSGERPTLTSRPRLFYHPHEITRDWSGKRVPVTAEVVSAQRGALEIQELAVQAEHAAMEQRPVIGLTDGTLILWNLEGKPHQFQQDILTTYLGSFDLMKSYQAPLMGYISRPGSTDVINVLRVGLCPENPANCDRCPYKGKEPELPCEPIEGVTDADLFEGLLQPGERSPVYQSQSAILEKYAGHAIYFFYLHVGAEIARIEIPRWIAYNQALLDLVHTAAYDQAQKGQGYPVSLAEAHEKAIIRGNEREQFFRLLEQLYVRQGLKVSLSRKFLKKRNVSI
jgi:hypothetical protein